MYVEIVKHDTYKWQFHLVDDEGIIIAKSHYHTSELRMLTIIDKHFPYLPIRGINFHDVLAEEGML